MKRYRFLIIFLLLSGCSGGKGVLQSDLENLSSTKSDVTFADKSSGGTFSAADANEIKTAVNSKADNDITVQVWVDDRSYVLGQKVFNGADVYTCIAPHLSVEALTKPGTGSAWTDAWGLTGHLLSDTDVAKLSNVPADTNSALSSAANPTIVSQAVAETATSTSPYLWTPQAVKWLVDYWAPSATVDQSGNYIWTGNHTFSGTTTFDGTVYFPANTTLPPDSVGADEFKDGTYGDVSILNGAFSVSGDSGVSVTSASTDPTNSSSAGFYENTTDNTLWLKTAAGLYELTTTSFTASPPLWDLTIDFVGVSGADKLTINSVDYSTDQTISDITAGTLNITASYGDSNTLVFSGTNAVSGSYPNYTIDMDADKSIVATFSTSSAYTGPIGNTTLYTDLAQAMTNTKANAFKLPLTTGTGTITSLTAGVASGTGDTARRFKLSLYAHDAVNNRPAGTPLATTAELTTTATELYYTAVSGTVSYAMEDATQYWIVLQAVDNYINVAKSAYGAVGKQTLKTLALTPYDWSEWTSSTDAGGNYAFTIYATVE